MCDPEAQDRVKALYVQALKEFTAGQSTSHIQLEARSAAQSDAKVVEAGQRLRVHELMLLPLSLIWLYEEHVLSVVQPSGVALAAAKASVFPALQPRKSARAQGLPPLHTLNPEFGLIARTVKPKADATAKPDSKRRQP
jgi:hypothetical protein